MLKQFDVSISARSLNSLRTQMHPVAVTITRSRNTHAPTRSHFSTISFHCCIPIVICCYILGVDMLVDNTSIYMYIYSRIIYNFPEKKVFFEGEKAKTTNRGIGE